jgi:hypothetical protein
MIFLESRLEKGKLLHNRSKAASLNLTAPKAAGNCHPAFSLIVVDVAVLNRGLTAPQRCNYDTSQYLIRGFSIMKFSISDCRYILFLHLYHVFVSLQGNLTISELFLGFLSGTDVFMEPVSGVFSRKSSGDVAFGLAKSLTIVIAKRKT